MPSRAAASFCLKRVRSSASRHNHSSNASTRSSSGRRGSSGNGNTATLSGATWTTGYSGQALAGNGSSSYVSANLGTTTRSDGTKQVTYKGHPLYFFEDDKKTGDTNGQGDIYLFQN